jgi:UDP-N-acetylmuramate--alanine ligase
MSKINLDKIKKIYFIGIEGAGTSPLAQIFHNLGFEVLGSDDGDGFYRDVLEKNDIKLFPDFKKENLPADVDLVVHSTAFKNDNPEMQEAKNRNITILPYPEALALVFNRKNGIAVTGTHGKTTITAMVSSMMQDAKLDPMAIVGSKVTSWKGNALIGKGDHFILEADEYQNKLQHYEPKIVILNNIDYDHPDFYPSFKEYKQAFNDFVEKLDKNSIVIANFDDEDVCEVIKGIKAKIISFGKNNADYSTQFADDNSPDNKFYVFEKEENLGEFKIGVIGDHNILNSLAVIALGRYLNIPVETIKKSLEQFSGTKRRAEKKGIYNGALIYDDYAHHPIEVQASLKAFKKSFPQKNIYCIFHPHSYTRTEALLDDFAKSLKIADKIIVLDIYGSARENRGNVHSRDLVKLLGDKALYISTLEECAKYLKPILKDGDLAITMGAGDVWKVGDKILNKDFEI